MKGGAETLAVALALVSAFFWAGFDAARKRLVGMAPPSVLVVWLCLLQAPLLAIWAGIAGRPGFPWISLVPLVVSSVFSVVGLLWFIQALRLAPFSMTVPLLSLTPVGTLLVAWAFRHQVPTFRQGIGALLVVGGALVLGAPSGHLRSLRTYVRHPGVRRMAGAASIWSITAVVDQVGLEWGAGSWYAPLLVLGLGTVMALLLLARGHGRYLLGSRRILARVPGSFLLAVLLGAAALVLQLEALRHISVGFVETIKRGVGMSGAILLGWLLFQEPPGPHKIFAVVLMALGVGLVAV